MNLALFDFDGTITTDDTFTSFIYRSIPRHRRLIGTLALSPFILGYKTGFIPARIMRIAISWFTFGGRKEETVQAEAFAYCQEHLPKVLRKNAMERLYWHKEQGDKVVVVSASLNAYLEPWCEQHGIELLCSTLEAKKGLLTGKYIAGDCSGSEKARRINNKYTLSEFDTVFAYGDTAEDNEMLDLADIKYYQWERLAQ